MITLDYTYPSKHFQKPEGIPSRLYRNLPKPVFSENSLITSADDSLVEQLKRLSFERKDQDMADWRVTCAIIIYLSLSGGLGYEWYHPEG